MIPEITFVQAAVLKILSDGEQAGSYIREKLAKQGHPKDGPSFYQFMSRLEKSKYVEGRYIQEIVDGQIIKQRLYMITAPGKKVLAEVETFSEKLTSSHGLI